MIKKTFGSMLALGISLIASDTHADLIKKPKQNPEFITEFTVVVTPSVAPKRNGAVYKPARAPQLLSLSTPTAEAWKCALMPVQSNDTYTAVVVDCHSKAGDDETGNSSGLVLAAKCFKNEADNEIQHIALYGNLGLTAFDEITVSCITIAAQPEH